MTKSQYLLLAFVVVCLSVIVIMSALTVETKRNFVDKSVEINVTDFPLAVDLSGVVFSVGDNLSGTVTVTNMCGKNVWVVSNGYMPFACLFNISDTDRVRDERMSMWEGILKTDGKLTQSFKFELTEPGTYVLYAYYSIKVNGVGLYSALEDIIIEVK
jgi:hypothetical protein